MSLTKVSYSMIKGSPVNVLDYGADPTGALPSTSAIQAAHDAIVNSGKPGVLQFGNGGTFLMDGPITVNAGFVSMRGNRSVLDFTTLGNVACITVIGGNGFSGNPYNQSDFTFEGFKLLGPSTGVGIYLNFKPVGSSVGPSHLAFRDLNIWNFANGVRGANRSYLNMFDHCDFYKCDIGFNLATTDLNGNSVIDSGSNYSLYGGTFYNCKTNIQQNQTTADVSCFGVTMGETSLGASGVNLIVGPNGAKVSMFGCRFESEGKAATVAGNSFLNLYGCSFICNTSTIDKYIENHGFLVINGGLAGGPGFNTGTNLIYSDSRANIENLHIVGTSSSLYNLSSGKYRLYNIDSNSLTSNGQLTSPSIGGTDTILKSLFSVTCSVLNTWVNTETFTTMGLYIVRDSTLGGMALFLADTSTMAIVSNNITGLEMKYDNTSGSFQFRITSGTAPRLLNFGVVRTV